MIGRSMPPADRSDYKEVFDVENNSAYARKLLDAYFHTPDMSEASWAAFPAFFLLKPEVVDTLVSFAHGEAAHRQAAQALRTCQAQAIDRSGYIGISKYGDGIYVAHRIDYSPYPFRLGDAASPGQAEFYALLSRFILHTHQQPGIYGDLTAPGEADPDVGSLLREIADRAMSLNKRLQHYPESMLISYDPSWPSRQVRQLLSGYADIDRDGHDLFVRYLRHAMRSNAGVGRKWRVAGAGWDTPTLPDSLVLTTADSHIQHADSNVLADRIEMAKVRAQHLARLSEETQSKALEAEEEKVRLEALAVVAARKQVADAEAASRAALDKLEQIRRARVAEEERIRTLEREHLAEERSATQALAERLYRLEGEQVSATHGGLPDEGAPESMLGPGDEALTPLITLDFQSIAIPHSALESAEVHASPHDPFAYEEQLQVKNSDVVATQQVGVHPHGAPAVEKRSVRPRPKRRALKLAHLLTAILCLSLGGMAGRYWFPASAPVPVPGKAQPISFPAESAETRAPASGVMASVSTADRGESAEKVGSVSLRMSGQLSSR